MSTCRPCQEIVCKVPDDVRGYNLIGLPPEPLPPVQGQIHNQQVRYCCPEGQFISFTGTLLSWITVDPVSNCLVGAAGTFVGPTQNAANITAQNALNEFAQAKIISGDLVCGAAPCIPPEFETQTFESALTVASPVSTFITSGGDHYSFDMTFAGTAGKSIAMWQGSSAFDTYLILIDPDGLIEAQNDDGGYNRFGDTGFNSALTVTLAKTGTYTVQATTSVAFAVGAFKLIVSEGVEAVITGIESGWIMIYVASTKRVFVLCGFDNTHGNKAALVVIDSTNNTVVADVSLTGLGGEAQPMLFYNPNDDSVWAGSDDGATNGFITRHSPLDGSLLETLPLGAAISPPRIFGAFVPSVNKVYGHAIGGPNFNYVDVYDCTTKAFLANIGLPDSLTAMECEYVADIDRVLIQGSAGKYYLINPNDNSVQTVALNIALGHFLNGFYYYVDPATSNYMKLDLLAGTTTVVNSFGYSSPDRSLGYNECRHKFAAYSAVNVGFPVWITMNSLDPVTFEPTESVVMEQLNPAGFNEQWIQTLWNPDLDRLYVLVGQVAGKIYVLS